MSHSTVARRVEALELRLGVKLFDRHRDGYLITDPGREMMAGAERVERGRQIACEQSRFKKLFAEISEEKRNAKS